MRQPTGRRTTIEIVADILRLLRLGATGKTEITCTVKVSRDQTSKYLNWLLETRLLEEVEKEIGVPCYRITEKGLSLLSKIENVQEMLPPNGALDFLHRSKLMEIVVPDNRIVESSEIEED
jgi:predicted transcriptional regulator